MNLIPESNGFKKVNMKEKVNAKRCIRNTLFVVIAIFLIGFIVQMLNNFFGVEKVTSSLNYAKIDSRKMEYKLSGSGDYTVVFDGALGTNLNQWNSVIETLKEKKLDVKTFVYNRKGYGFSDGGNLETPEKQAEDLKVLLRKAGVSGKLILVGEEYGSLVMTNFASLYSDSVAGMVLIKPYSEDKVKSEKFKSDIKWPYLKSKIEKTGTMFSLTMLMDKMNLDYSIPEFEEYLTGDSLKEFNILKNQSSYRKAINNELESLYTYSGNTQAKGLMSNKPLYIITNDEEDPIQKIGSENLTTIYKTELQGTVISISDPSSVATGIANVTKEAKKISKQSGN
ncbi:MAG: alpha/beta hydrolase [Clostridium sp.]|nr:alpha/beta hydrolase [Clostridium sp.]